MNEISIETIKQFLPHRYPFLLIDRVIDYDLAKQSITVIKNVTFNEPFFQGHFPDPEPSVMPGVMIIEAFAQASAIYGMVKLGANNDDKENSNPHAGLYYLGGINEARFRHVVIPGDQLLIKVQCLRNKRGVWHFESQGYVEDELVASAKLSLVVKPL